MAAWAGLWGFPIWVAALRDMVLKSGWEHMPASLLIPVVEVVAPTARAVIAVAIARLETSSVKPVALRAPRQPWSTESNSEVMVRPERTVSIVSMNLAVAEVAAVLPEHGLHGGQCRPFNGR